MKTVWPSMLVPVGGKRDKTSLDFAAALNVGIVVTLAVVLLEVDGTNLDETFQLISNEDVARYGNVAVQTFVLELEIGRGK